MFKRIYIEITNICNLNCEFCKKDNRKKDYMKVEDFNIVLNKIKGYTKNIYLHIKGEPLMHPNLKELLVLANNHNLLVNITTNGRLINKNINIINESNIRQINISLHSYDDISKINDLLTTVDNIKKDIMISYRIWRDNNFNEIINILEEYYNIKLNQGNRTTIKDNIFLNLDNEFTWPDMNKDIIQTKGTCLGLRQQLGILVDGTIVPCCLDQDGDINLGNIYKDDLKDVLNSDRVINIINGFRCNKLVEPLCMRCGYIYRFTK